MRKINILLGALFLAACTGTIATPRATLIPTGTKAPLSRPRLAAASPTETPLWTDTPQPALTLPATSTPTWVVQGPGDLSIPILLYHHIDVSPINSRYYVPPEKFGKELKALHDWGYTTISTQMLVQAIRMGCKLPPHPMLITFDDGHIDNYVNAFPIMQKYGFTGVLYIVANYLGADGFLDREQILKMHDAGWEVGSHSMNHYDLTKLSPDDQRAEIVESKKKLERVLGIDILTFAYPFGAKDPAVLDYVNFAGYIAAMGAEGYADKQGDWNLLNLQRVEIKGSEDVESMTRFLTWHGPIK